MKWLTNEYDRLYKQVKEEVRQVVCFVDYPFSRDESYLPVRDLARIRDAAEGAWVYGRGTGYGSPLDPSYKGTEEERFIQMCQHLNVQWLDESEEDVRQLLKQYHFYVMERIFAVPQVGKEAYASFANVDEFLKEIHKR